MKTYKHKTTNYKAESKSNNPDSYIVEMADRIITLPAQLVEDPGFGWVLQKDYEILEVRGPAGGSFKPITPAHIRDFPVYSVKRLSDGEVFSVGHEDQFAGEVRRFVETSKGLYAECRDYDVRIGVLIKSKRKPILTSENGVELFEGDDYWWIHKDSRSCNIHSRTLTDTHPVRRYVLYFSTKEAAEEYRLNNARVLSKKDILDCWADPYTMGVRLRELVKSRL